MGKIWFYMISIGIVGSIITNNLGELNKVILNEASRGVEFAISLAGVMALWMGIMNIAKDSGLIDKIGKKLNPIMRRLFPSIPKGHKAMSYMVMNMALDMGAQTPSDIILTTLFATTMSTIIAVISCKLLQGRNR